MQIRYYVYILKSLLNTAKTYVGITNDINRRLSEHNSKTQTYSKRYAPWELIAYTVFFSREKAESLEKYFKTPSGKAVLNKHFM